MPAPGQANDTETSIVPAVVAVHSSDYESETLADGQQKFAVSSRLRTAWRRVVHGKTTIAAIVCLALATTLLGTLLTRPVYRASASIELSTNSQTVNTSSAEFLEEFLDSQVELLNSLAMADAVVERLDLQDDVEISGQITQRGISVELSKMVAKIQSWMNVPEIQDAKHAVKLSVVKRFNQRLLTARLLAPPSITINFDSFDPERSARIANGVVDTFVQVIDEGRSDSGSDARKNLDKEIRKVLSKLESSETKLRGFEQQNNLVDAEKNSNGSGDSLAELVQHLNTVKTNRIAAEAEYLSGSRSSAAVTKSRVISSLKTTRSKTLDEFLRLSDIYADKHPALLQVRQKITQIDQQIVDETRKIIDALKAASIELREQESRLSEELSAKKRSMQQQQRLTTARSRLVTERELHRQQHNALHQRMDELRKSSEHSFGNFLTIRRAEVPTSKMAPDLLTNLMVATALSLLFSLVFVQFLGYLANTFSEAVELQHVLNLSVLGVVPSDAKRYRFKQSSKDLSSQPLSVQGVADAFQSLRTKLLTAFATGMPATVLVTSSIDSEGKSLISTNIAWTIAEQGSKVLLVDCDMHGPELHKTFSKARTPGLGDLLTGREQAATIHCIEVDRLYFLSSGTSLANSAQHLGSPKMESTLASLKQDYDHLILDGTSILGVADAVSLSQKIDAVVLVVSANEVNRDQAQEAVKRLRLVHAPLIGAVLNKAAKSPRS